MVAVPVVAELVELIVMEETGREEWEENWGEEVQGRRDKRYGNSGVWVCGCGAVNQWLRSNKDGTLRLLFFICPVSVNKNTAVRGKLRNN